MKNKHWAIVILLILCTKVNAQDYSISLAGINKVSISSETIIILKSHNTPSLLIKDSENHRTSNPENIYGLKKLTGRGNDNTNYGIEIHKNGDLLMVKGLRGRRASSMVIHLPATINIFVESLANNEVYIDGFKADLEIINHHGGTVLTNITGPVISENRNGSISVSFIKLNQAYPMSIITENGDIDVRLPTAASANISAKTPRGDFYTDFNLIFDTVNARTNYQRSIHGKINNGGVEINLQNLKGNIYLRQND